MIKKYEHLIFPDHIKRCLMKGEPIQFCIKACIDGRCNKSCEQIRGIRHYDLRIWYINLYLHLHLCPDCPQSLFYYVPQDYHSQAGSTNLCPDQTDSERNGGFGRLDAAVGVGMEIVSSIGLPLSLDSSSTNPAQPFLGRVIHFLLPWGPIFPRRFSCRGKNAFGGGRAILIISEVKKLMGTKRRRDVQVEAQPVGWEQSCMQSHTVCCTISQSHKHTVCYT